MINEYGKLRNQVGHMIEPSKTDYLNDMSLLYSDDPKGLWKEIHKIAGSDKHVNNILTQMNLIHVFCKCGCKDIRHI